MSTSGCIKSTSTMPCIATLSTAARVVLRSHPLYINYVMRRDYSSPGCTGSTSILSCALVPLDFRSVGRTSSLCTWSLRLAAQLLVVRIAPAPLRLCRASGRVVSPLDFSSVGRTGSRRAFGHCISRRDYSSSVLHRLYCAYAVHPEAPSRRSTSRQSVALALAMCPVILLCVVTTR
jgi:hypothetical protein